VDLDPATTFVLKDRSWSFTRFYESKSQFMTYINFGQLSRDNSMEHIPRFHTPQMGNTFGRKVEPHKKVINMFQ
jgi:hypothetical protein